jgi:hypothetical protein
MKVEFTAKFQTDNPNGGKLDFAGNEIKRVDKPKYCWKDNERSEGILQGR